MREPVKPGRSRWNQERAGPWRLVGNTLHNNKSLPISSVIICQKCIKWSKESLDLSYMVNLGTRNPLGGLYSFCFFSIFSYHMRNRLSMFAEWAPGGMLAISSLRLLCSFPIESANCWCTTNNVCIWLVFRWYRRRIHLQQGVSRWGF